MAIITKITESCITFFPPMNEEHFFTRDLLFLFHFFKLHSGSKTNPDAVWTLGKISHKRASQSRKKTCNFKGCLFFVHFTQSFKLAYQTYLHGSNYDVRLSEKIVQQKKNCYTPSFCTTTWELSKNCVKGATVKEGTPNRSASVSACVMRRSK